ncbi:MAG: hypothetical protein BM558_04335 [Roseobacter sp. MedPE-SW]|nr:MAG: hypothetical protein BM558_04335 [Roseobacter sp. MedPE-SW]
MGRFISAMKSKRSWNDASQSMLQARNSAVVGKACAGLLSWGQLLISKNAQIVKIVGLEVQ